MNIDQIQRQCKREPKRIDIFIKECKWPIFFFHQVVGTFVLKI